MISITIRSRDQKFYDEVITQVELREILNITLPSYLLRKLFEQYFHYSIFRYFSIEIYKNFNQRSQRTNLSCLVRKNLGNQFEILSEHMGEEIGLFN